MWIMYGFMRIKPFHQSKEWRALARRHKALHRGKLTWRCKDCGYEGELQSDHILSVKRYPELALMMSNLCLRCDPCNKKKSDKTYADLLTFKVMLRQSIKKAVIATIIIGVCYGVVGYLEQYHH